MYIVEYNKVLLGIGKWGIEFNKGDNSEYIYKWYT